MPQGIEFAGGTSVIVQFDQTPSVDSGARRARPELSWRRPERDRPAVRRSVAAAGDGPRAAGRRGAGRRAERDGAERRRRAAARPTSATSRSSAPRSSGPSVGEELTQQGHLGDRPVARRHPRSTSRSGSSSRFAVGAVVATLHDLLVTLAFLAFFRYDLTLNVIAAILTITGYSTNDTIVIFDRVRENLRDDAPRLAERRHQHRRSTRRSAGRSSPPARRCSRRIALFLFGGEVLHGFAFTMIVGHHHRHLLERVHRRGDRHVLAPEQAVEAGGRAHGRRRRRAPPAPRASRSRSARRERRSRAAEALRLDRARRLTYLLAALLGVVQGLTSFCPSRRRRTCCSASGCSDSRIRAACSP